MAIQYPFEVEGTLTRVIEAGSGDHSIVMVHGVGSRADRWRWNIDGLASQGLHTYAIDLPGHGFASKSGNDEYSVPQFARFIAGFIEGMEAERVVLIGSSMGGHIAAYLALEELDLIKAIILVGSTGLAPLGEEKRSAISGRLVDWTYSGVRARILHSVFDEALATEEWIAEEVRVNNSPGASEALNRIAEYIRREIDEHELGGKLGDISKRMPALLVWGSHDRSVPVEMGQRASASMPGSEFHVIPETAHIPYFERPSEFDRVVVQFLKSRLGDW